MERIGIYGGTFDPIHIGHIQGAKYAQKMLSLDRVLLLPDRQPPHKQLTDRSASAENRLEMVRLAVDGEPGVEVCDLTFRREGSAYACDTVEVLRGMYPEAQLTYLMGADMFLSFLNWREPDRIWKHASLAVLCRGGAGEMDKLTHQKMRLEDLGARVELLDNPVNTISSTMIRRMLPLRCAGEHLNGSVLKYILDHGLYGTNRDLQGLSIEALQDTVVSLLKPNRVAHVLGCAETSAELARRWGADETNARRAGLLHDITKAMDGPLQLTLCREYGIVLDNFSSQNPKTLHALTGSLVADRIFGENDAVISAIRSHTTGKANMNLLEKIIYVADYMEPNRDFPGVEELRSLAFSDIDKALKLGLTMTLEMLRQQKRQISPESQSALRWLEEHGV